MPHVRAGGGARVAVGVLHLALPMLGLWLLIERPADELGARAVVAAREPVPIKGKREPVPTFLLRALMG